MKIYTGEIWNALSFYRDEGINFAIDDSDDTELQQDYREEWERICKTMEQLEDSAGIDRESEWRGKGYSNILSNN